MTEEIDLELATHVVTDMLRSQTSRSYAAGFDRPLSTALVKVEGNALVFEVVDIVAQQRVMFKAVVETL